MDFVWILFYFVFIPYCIENHSTGLDCENGLIKDADCCEGYNRTLEGDCIPICKGGCPKPKVCRRPDKCGYQNQKFSKARKDCYLFMINTKHDCRKCNPSYIFIKGECKPHCGRCIHGYCDSPGICKCDPGYQMNTKNNICKAIDISLTSKDCFNINSCQDVANSTTKDENKDEGFIIKLTDVVLSNSFVWYAIGVILAVLIVIIIIVFCYRSCIKRRRRDISYETDNISNSFIYFRN